ncbi:TIGR02594 family protein [uncultured Aquimarina sp.]|uniref:TIGR02594 family protein n=1 Tax=uncultured Aquimarina sp. TaxID=575652 RepID=UPI00261B2D82|nr:TIGR02594 family protein [uncultured Aquimarina sp.]
MSKTLNIALAEYGVTEVVGDHHHPRILQYFKEIGHKWVTTDETAWCSAYANWVALKAGCYRSGKLNARSWLKVGAEVKNPQQGDVVIFWREKRSSWKGHVGFFIGYSEDRKYIYVLGGNQNNKVCIKPYPTYRLLGFRSIKKSFKPILDAA